VNGANFFGPSYWGNTYWGTTAPTPGVPLRMYVDPRAGYVLLDTSDPYQIDPSSGIRATMAADMDIDPRQGYALADSDDLGQIDPRAGTLVN
jgi:hypothetical protein